VTREKIPRNMGQNTELGFDLSDARHVSTRQGQRMGESVLSAIGRVAAQTALRRSLTHPIPRDGTEVLTIPPLSSAPPSCPSHGVSAGPAVCRCL